MRSLHVCVRPNEAAERVTHMRPRWALTFLTRSRDALRDGDNSLPSKVSLANAHRGTIRCRGSPVIVSALHDRPATPSSRSPGRNSPGNKDLLPAGRVLPVSGSRSSCSVWIWTAHLGMEGRKPYSEYRLSWMEHSHLLGLKGFASGSYKCFGG